MDQQTIPQIRGPIKLDIEKYLTPECRAFYRRTVSNTVLEFEKPKDPEVIRHHMQDCLRWGILPRQDFGSRMCVEALTGHQHTRDDATRYITQVQYFRKIVHLDTPGAEVPESYIERTARVIQKLYDAGKIFLGFLAQVTAMPVNDSETDPKVMIFFAVAYRDENLEGPWPEGEPLPYQKLNAHLGNIAFMREGEYGNDDWTNL